MSNELHSIGQKYTRIFSKFFKKINLGLKTSQFNGILVNPTLQYTHSDVFIPTSVM